MLILNWNRTDLFEIYNTTPLIDSRESIFVHSPLDSFESLFYVFKSGFYSTHTLFNCSHPVLNFSKPNLHFIKPLINPIKSLFHFSKAGLDGLSQVLDGHS